MFFLLLPILTFSTYLRHFIKYDPFSKFHNLNVHIYISRNAMNSPSLKPIQCFLFEFCNFLGKIPNSILSSSSSWLVIYFSYVCEYIRSSVWMATLYLVSPHNYSKIEKHRENFRCEWIRITFNIFKTFKWTK